MSFPEAVASTLKSNDIDIRPRIYDGITKEWILIDTGSQCSVTKAKPEDSIRPDILLETVDGTHMKCYGTKPLELRLGRKQYKIDTVIAKSTDTILGMDFLDKYGFEFRRGEFGDLYLYDPKSQSSTLCQFIKTNSSLPRVSAIRVSSSIPRPSHSSMSSLDIFGLAALSVDSSPEIQKALPEDYRKLLEKYPEILKPNFKEVKHSVKHSAQISSNAHWKIRQVTKNDTKCPRMLCQKWS